MLLRHLGAILPPHDSKKRETVIAWSPDSSKLAVTSINCTLYLFDNKCAKKDEFSTKTLNAKNHSIKGLAFSPDSTKLAVGHTDGFVKVYNIGKESGKKNVEFELHQGSAVTCLAWPSDDLIVVGLENGKVATVAISSRMTTILCDAGSTTIALTTNSRGTGLLSSHVDGKIRRYHVTDTGTIEFTNQPTLVHPLPAQALAWTHHNYVLAGGRDRRLVFYDSRGKPHQVFNFCGNLTPEGLTVACCGPSGQNVVVGTWDGMRILNLSPRTTLWEDIALTSLPKGGPVVAVAWRRDGTQLVVGALNGSVEHYEVSLRSPTTFGATGYEVLYVEPSLAIISSLGDERAKPIVVRSRAGHEIEDVKLLGNHVIARTAATLIICELNSDSVSEIPRDNDKDIPTSMSNVRMTVESTRDNGEKVTQNDSKLCAKEPKQVTSVTFDTEQKHGEKNGVSQKTWDLADLMMSRSKSKKNNESDNSLSSSCSLGLSDSRNKSDDEATRKANRQPTNANNFVYATRGNNLGKSLERDKIINISSNRKTCKYTTEDSVCWTLSLDAVSENETDQRKSKSRPELNVATSSPGTVARTTSELSYPTSDWRSGNSTKKSNGEQDAYKPWTQTNSEQMSSVSSTPEIPLPGLTASSPIRFTRQYTPEELRGDFSLQLAVMASLPPGLQRVLEKQAMTEEKN